MILTCPSCGTRYQTDGAAFAPPGRNVRCAKCRQVWFQPAPEPEQESEPEPIAVVGAPEEQPAERTESIASDIGPGPSPSEEYGYEIPVERRRRGWASVGAWLALLLILGGLGAATVIYRQAIADLWPQSASLYAAIGLPVNTRGIELVNISYRQDVEDGQPVLSVSGKLVNITNRELPVPALRVVLTDEAKHELYHWNFDAGVQTLKPGAESPFLTRLSSPPQDAVNLNIRFAEAGETQ